MKFEYKGYLIKSDKDVPNNYVVVTAGQGGKIPDVLSSLYTTRQYAKDAIDLYLSTKKKGKDNDQEVNQG